MAAGGGGRRISNPGESGLGWTSTSNPTAEEEEPGGCCGRRMLVDGVAIRNGGVHLAAVPIHDDVPFHEWTKCHESANQYY